MSLVIDSVAAVAVTAADAAPLLYEDGKTLKGIGTRASKSRLSSAALLSRETPRKELLAP